MAKVDKKEKKEKSVNVKQVAPAKEVIKPVKDGKKKDKKAAAPAPAPPAVCFNAPCSSTLADGSIEKVQKGCCPAAQARVVVFRV